MNDITNNPPSLSPELPAGLSDLPDLSERLPIDASDLIFDEELQRIRKEIEDYQRTLPKDGIMSSVFGKHKVVGIGSPPPVDHSNNDQLHSKSDQVYGPSLGLGTLIDAAKELSAPKATTEQVSPNFFDAQVYDLGATEDGEYDPQRAEETVSALRIVRQVAGVDVDPEFTALIDDSNRLASPPEALQGNSDRSSTYDWYRETTEPNETVANLEERVGVHEAITAQVLPLNAQIIATRKAASQVPVSYLEQEKKAA